MCFEVPFWSLYNMHVYILVTECPSRHCQYSRHEEIPGWRGNREPSSAAETVTARDWTLSDCTGTRLTCLTWGSQTGSSSQRSTVRRCTDPKASTSVSTTSSRWLHNHVLFGELIHSAVLRCPSEWGSVRVSWVGRCPDLWGVPICGVSWLVGCPEWWGVLTSGVSWVVRCPTSGVFWVVRCPD